MSAAEKVVVHMPKGRGGGGTGAGSGDAADWRHALVRNDKGKPTNCIHNLMLVLANDPHLEGMFSLDEFSNAVFLTRAAPWKGGHLDEFVDADAVELAAWVGHPDRYTLATKPDAVLACVEAVARRKAVHPVRDYLRGLKWDGTPRVERMFSELFGAADSAYVRKAACCFMVSAVARILWVDQVVRHQGAKVDFMLVFESDQGKGKTTGVQMLFGPRWYAEALESPASKDFYQSLRGRWCVEIGEMDSFNKADVTKVKQAITSRFDTYRPSYGRVTRSYRRECVFVGTTNEHEYLRDATGGRRFLPVKVGAVQVQAITEARDQLWAEAVQLYGQGFKWWELPEEARQEQEDRYQADPWEEVILAWLRSKPDSSKAYPLRLHHESSIGWVTTSELLLHALNIDLGKQGRPEQMRISSIMRRIGWEHRRLRDKDEGRVRRWEPVNDCPF